MNGLSEVWEYNEKVSKEAGRLIVTYPEQREGPSNVTIIFTSQVLKLLEGYEPSYISPLLAALAGRLGVTMVFVHVRSGNVSADFDFPYPLVSKRVLNTTR